VLLALTPLVGGVHQLMFLPGSAAYLKDTAGIPFATPAFASCLAIVQVAGAVSVLIGWRTRTAAKVLGGYYALVAVVIQFPMAHRAVDLVARDQETGNGLRSLAIAGGFLALAALGPGAHSVDRR
jgi:putative oxidoreductase